MEIQLIIDEFFRGDTFVCGGGKNPPRSNA